jgi:plastocyanin
MFSQRQGRAVMRLGLAAGLWLSTALSLGPVHAQEAITADAPADDTSQVIVDQPVVPMVEVTPVVEAAPPTAPAAASVDAPPAAPAAATPVAPAPAATTSVAATVVDNRFQPATLSIGVGTTVTWTNAGTNLHTLTSADGLFESGVLQPGQTFSYTFSQPGTYQLICRQHRLNGMAAKVIVQ